MKISAGKAALVGLLTTSALAVLPAQAQDEESARKGVFSIGFGIDAGNNVDLSSDNTGADAKFSPHVGYDYTMKTGTTELTFGISANPEVVSGEKTRAQPKLNLSYAHVSPRTSLKFNASYQRSKVTDQSIGFDDSGVPFFYDGTGERGQANVSAQLTGGIDMPLGYSLGLKHSETDYYNMVGTSQSPSTTDGVTFGLRADLSSTRQLGLNFSHTLYDVDNADQLERRSDSASLRFDQRLNAVTSLGVSVGRSRVESDRLTGDKTTEGTTWGLSLSRETPLATYALSYDRSINENGNRDEVSLARKAETKLGQFDGSVGLSRGEAGGTDVIASLGYGVEMRRDRLDIDLSRAVSTDDDGNDVLYTRFSGQYAHDLSEVNAINLGLTASLTNSDTQDTTRVDGSIGYSHALTSDIDLSAGLRLGLSQRTGKPDADEQALFFTFNRRFETLR